MLGERVGGRRWCHTGMHGNGSHRRGDAPAIWDSNWIRLYGLVFVKFSDVLVQKIFLKCTDEKAGCSYLNNLHSRLCKITAVDEQARSSVDRESPSESKLWTGNGSPEITKLTCLSARWGRLYYLLHTQPVCVAEIIIAWISADSYPDHTTCMDRGYIYSHTNAAIQELY